MAPLSISYAEGYLKFMAGKSNIRNSASAAIDAG
jgi:hypothetical protein